MHIWLLKTFNQPAHRVKLSRPKRRLMFPGAPIPDRDVELHLVGQPRPHLRNVASLSVLLVRNTGTSPVRGTTQPSAASLTNTPRLFLGAAPSLRFRVGDCNTLCHSSSTWPDKYSSPSSMPTGQRLRGGAQRGARCRPAPCQATRALCDVLPFLQTHCCENVVHLPLHHCQLRTLPPALAASRRWSASPSSAQCLPQHPVPQYRCGTKQGCCCFRGNRAPKPW